MKTLDSYAEPNGGWEWVTGECLDYENWSTGEPNNASTPPNGESYSHMTSFGTWNDWDDATATFIMEINCQDPIEICAVPGCMDSWACNYDSDATIDNGECEYLNDPIVSMTDYEWVLEYENGCYGEPTEISGSFILTFFNNNTWSNQNGVTGQWSLCGNTLVRFLGDDPEGNYIFEGSFDGTQFSGYYDESIVTDYGCFTLTPIINGCTDTVACNYDSTANTNDGSCEYISCLDECGVPNGDNSTCLDECGVINGDNSTCIVVEECFDTDNGAYGWGCLAVYLEGYYCGW